MTTQTKPITTPGAYYWAQVRTHPKQLAGALISVPITILVNDYLTALILAETLAKLSQHHYQTHHIWASFGPQLVLYAILMLVGMALWRVTDYFTWQLETRIQRQIAQQVFDHLLAQGADFHANNFTGSLVSQTNKLLSGYVRIADTTVYQVYPLIAGLVFTAIILLPRAPLFTALFLVFALLYFASTFLASKPVRRASARFAAAESQQTGYLADAVANVLAIKSYANGRYERDRFNKVTLRTKRRLSIFARYHQIQMGYLGFFSRVISGLSLTMAVIGVMVFHANIGTVFLILSYTGVIVEQLFQFGNSSLRNYNRSLGDAKEMVSILATTPEVQDKENCESSRISTGAISFNAVEFTHNGADDALFNGLNLDIRAGEKIGLVGHSGSGKTTITRLLMRFSDIQAGEILIDGQNIANITQDDLHANIAYVPQEPLLFHRTIAENIAYGRLEADQQAVMAVAKLAHADEFIANLPKGYDTLVGERGVKLSGGQRQRVAIARAMLKDAPILLLDEATSALDSESEVLIQDALWKLMEGRTAVVIAHRLSTIQKMDRIIVLDEGEIVEQGTHQELLKNNGTYAKLWAHQSGGFMED